MKTDERIADYVNRTGTRNPERIRCYLKRNGAAVPMALIRDWLDARTDQGMPEEPGRGLRGISLTNVRLSDKKPSEGLKAKIYGLQKGRGFPMEELAREWCVSAGTLRSHARQYDCMKYVEVATGEWVACVLHPDTAVGL
ncbi:MAG: hypothetical protein ACOYNN_17900 [Terrimicrobiaceae bacterium]